MVNQITEARQDVAEALSGIEGLQVFDYIPNRLTAPAAVVTPGSPYVVPGQVLGELRISLNVRVFAIQATSNEVVSNALDDLIVSVCEALRAFGVVAVSMPGIDSESYDQTYLVSDITINTTYQGGN